MTRVMHVPRLSKYLSGVVCFACNTPHDPRQLLTVCTKCGLPLRVNYDLSRVRLRLKDMLDRPPTLWRYREVLPLESGDEVSLAEGFTPLLPVERNIWVKDEARNPTGSFKARGMTVAISMARLLGARALPASASCELDQDECRRSCFFPGGRA